MLGLVYLIKRIADLLYIIVHLWKQDEKFRTLIILMSATLVTGSIFYFIVEGWRVIDSICFCVMTIATLGYGYFLPRTALLKIFTITLALSGIEFLWELLQSLHNPLLKKELKNEANINLKLIKFIRTIESIII